MAVMGSITLILAGIAVAGISLVLYAWYRDWQDWKDWHDQ